MFGLKKYFENKKQLSEDIKNKMEACPHNENDWVCVPIKVKGRNISLISLIFNSPIIDMETEIHICRKCGLERHVDVHFEA